VSEPPAVNSKQPDEPLRQTLSRLAATDVCVVAATTNDVITSGKPKKELRAALHLGSALANVKEDDGSIEPAATIMPRDNQPILVKAVEVAPCR